MAQESRNNQFSTSGGPSEAPQQTVQQQVAAPPQQSHASQSNQPSPRPCPQDCSRCPVSQQVYCSTKMLFDLSRAYQETRQQLAAMESVMAAIQSQLQPKDDNAPLSTPIIEAT